MKKLDAVNLAFLVIGILVLFAAAVAYVQQNDFLNEALKVEGEVIELVKRRSDNGMVYSPVVRFADQNGTLIEFMSSIGSSPPHFAVGERVNVLYSPSDTGDAVIDTFIERWMKVMILGGLGGLFSVFGLALMIWKPTSNKKFEFEHRGVL